MQTNSSRTTTRAGTKPNLLELCYHGYHYCRDCDAITEPQDTDTPYTICKECKAFNSLTWMPPAFEQHE